MKEPPFGDNPAPPPPAPAPRKSLPPARPQVTRGDLEALIESKFDVKSRRGDQREARCPAHEDKRASLGLKIVPHDDGGDKVIVKCQAGCDTRDVLAAVGLAFADLFTYEPKAKRGSGKGRVVATYAYTDEKGVPLFAVVRFEPKDFRQHALNPDGSTPEGPWSIKGIRRVLFRLPRVLEAVELKRTVWVAEGEKDVLRLEALGLYATCNMGGAASGPNDKKWLPEYADQLAGAAEVVVVPDNDEPGRRHAETIAASLKGRVGSVTTLDLARFWPECPVKGDASNFLDAHPGIDGARKLAEFVAAAKQPQELEKVGAAPVVEAEKVTAFAKKLKRESDGLLLMDEKQLDWRNDEIPWRDRMAYTISQGGKLKYTSCPYNVGLVLEQHEYLKGRIRYDVFANEIRFTPPERWREPGPERFWCEKDTTEFRMWADRYLNPESTTQFKREMVEECVLKVADDHPCHPLREWLESLKWDGEPRLKHWLSFFCNVEEDEYVQLVGEKWMISAVARIFEPGCKADHMLVLRGPQGIKKTGLFETLGGPYYTEYRGVKLDDKDGKQFLQGKWIVEFSELEALNRVEAGAMKAFLTGREDRFREPFGRKTRDFKRSNVFAGTINEGEFLKDETGNRRFWIVDCGSARIDLKRLELMRPQLFAEAVALYRAGERWWLEGREEELAREVQADHMEPSLHEDSIRDWLEDESRAPGTFLAEAGTHNGERFVTLEMVWRHALKGNVVGWNKTQQYQTAAGLARAGWKKKLYRPGPGIRRKAWFKVAPEQPKLEEDPDVLPY